MPYSRQTAAAPCIAALTSAWVGRSVPVRIGSDRQESCVRALLQMRKREQLAAELEQCPRPPSVTHTRTHARTHARTHTHTHTHTHRHPQGYAQACARSRLHLQPHLPLLPPACALEGGPSVSGACLAVAAALPFRYLRTGAVRQFRCSGMHGTQPAVRLRAGSGQTRSTPSSVRAR